MRRAAARFGSALSDVLAARFSATGCGTATIKIPFLAMTPIQHHTADLTVVGFSDPPDSEIGPAARQQGQRVPSSDDKPALAKLFETGRETQEATTTKATPKDHVHAAWAVAECCASPVR